jgi:hypothetical protein
LATESGILPDLINLRIFSNVIYFTGRYEEARGLSSFCPFLTGFMPMVEQVKLRH